MTNPATGSIIGLGSVVSSGYPVFGSQDSAGTIATPNGNYVWNPNTNLWIPWPVDANGNPQTSISSILRKLAFSTTTPLGANAVYTSPTVDGMNYRNYTYRVLADASGTLQPQHSDDGITWDNLVVSSSVPANTIVKSSESIIQMIPLRYMRFVYTNGATAQTSIFRFSCYLSPL